MLSHSVLSLGSLLLAVNFHGTSALATKPLDEALSAVDLGTADDFAILTKAGVTTTGAACHVTGDVGTSPIAATALTGFALTMHSGTTYSTSPLVTGQIFAASYTSPTPSKMTTAISDMETAYTDAAGRVNPDVLDLGAGTIDGLTLAPGLYKWGSSVDFTKLTFKGKDLAQGADPVWILQVTGDLIVGAGAIVTLTNGALAKNIFWQVAGSTTLHTTAAMKGIILCAKSIVFQTGSSLNGKALAQTAVTLDAATIVKA
uniref:Ice-binding protein n=1 Tax=Phaeocystis antarctica TaxID=33657 RepID=A0A7S0F287_9EUKA|mmetsp:Transcript_35933/g.84787  ORF Transcript_35933/g.84787 Transcript_35933/m.84787 type:complete len:259 (+) Transcript_35933:100-876(+)